LLDRARRVERTAAQRAVFVGARIADPSRLVASFDQRVMQ
jgi:hypothetical protein